MKAVIMAGGEGTRLRPISSGCPKPMVKLLDKPLLYHIFKLLKKAGIREVCTTLRYMPEEIISYFGDGGDLGMKISHKIESKPLGTAGGVAACRDFFKDESFLVVSGDAACDFDLTKLIEDHMKNQPAVTLALFSYSEPLQYGTVLTDPEGRVLEFIEKPDWEQVITDLVNTGIYIISPGVMDLVPKDTEFDFARDLFPLLMEKGEMIRGVALDGYWCDVGNPAACLQCARDALSGKLRIENTAREAAPGVWSDRELPGDVKVMAPSFIGGRAVIGPGAVIGPFTVIGGESYVGADAVIEGSVADSAFIGPDARIRDSFVCRNANVPMGERVPPGSVISSPGASMPPRKKAGGAGKNRTPMQYARELPCDDRARAMRVLSESLVEAGADFHDGLQLKTKKGKVRISPSPSRSALIIEASAKDMEASAELAVEYERWARRLHGQKGR